MTRLGAFLFALAQSLMENGEPNTDRPEPSQRYSQRYPKRSLTAVLTLSKGITEQLAADQQKSDARQDELLRIERRRLRIEKIALLFTLAGTFATLGTLWLLYQSVIEAQKAATAAQSSSAAAERATAIANDSLVAQNRPWLFFERRLFRAHVTEGITEVLAVQNGGQTPALGIAGCATFEIIKLTESPHFGQRPCQQIEIAVLAPGGKTTEVATALRMFQPNVKPAWLIPDTETIRAIQDGSAYIATHARLTYRDVFGVEHWAQLCDAQYLGPPLMALNASLNTCAKYNSMDGNTQRPN